MLKTVHQTILSSKAMNLQSPHIYQIRPQMSYGAEDTEQRPTSKDLPPALAWELQARGHVEVVPATAQGKTKTPTQMAKAVPAKEKTTTWTKRPT